MDEDEATVEANRWAATGGADGQRAAGLSIAWMIGRIDMSRSSMLGEKRRCVEVVGVGRRSVDEGRSRAACARAAAAR